MPNEWRTGRVMFALVVPHTLNDRNSKVKPAIGEVVAVDVPSNCSIHDADSQKLARIVALAEQIGAHWRNQEGVNGALLDELAMWTTPAPCGEPHPQHDDVRCDLPQNHGHLHHAERGATTMTWADPWGNET